VSGIHRAKNTPRSLLLSRDDPEYYEPGLPVVAFHFSDEFRVEYPEVQQSAVSTLLRVKGWILPNYPLPPNEEHTEILRVVVRESFSTSPPRATPG
jgi:glutamate decarboxylase